MGSHQHLPTDLDRLQSAFAELRQRGYLTSEGGCCSNCGLADIAEQAGRPRGHQNIEGLRLAQYDDQGLDVAFGERYLPDDWKARLEAADTDEEEDRLFQETLDRDLWIRPTQLAGTLWVTWRGSADEVVAVLRSHGLDAYWYDDFGTVIKILPRGSE
jgi:Domain of unknown function (DUF6891)